MKKKLALFVLLFLSVYFVSITTLTAEEIKRVVLVDASNISIIIAPNGGEEIEKDCAGVILKNVKVLDEFSKENINIGNLLFLPIQMPSGSLDIANEVVRLLSIALGKLQPNSKETVTISPILFLSDSRKLSIFTESNSDDSVMIKLGRITIWRKEIAELDNGVRYTIEQKLSIGISGARK